MEVRGDLGESCRPDKWGRPAQGLHGGDRCPTHASRRACRPSSAWGLTQYRTLTSSW